MMEESKHTPKTNFFENWTKNLDALFLIKKQLEVLDGLFYTKAEKKYEEEYKRNKNFWATIRYSLIKGVAIDLANLCNDDTSDHKVNKKAFSIQYWEWFFSVESKKQKRKNNQASVSQCKTIIYLITELKKPNGVDMSKLRSVMAHNSFNRKSSNITIKELKSICAEHEKLLDKIVQYFSEKHTNNTKQGKVKSKNEDESVINSCKSIMKCLLE